MAKLHPICGQVHGTASHQSRFPAVLLLAGLLAGCHRHFAGFSGSWSDADLKAVASASAASPIPASLKTLEVENYDGAIEVAGSTMGKFQWAQTVKVRAHTDAEAQDFVKALTCRAELDGDSLKLTVKPPEPGAPGSLQSDFQISVPAGVSVRTGNHYGSTTITSVSGSVNVTGESGSVTIRHAAGEVRAQTSYATLTADHTGPATLTDQSGTLEAYDINGPLVAETSYASLNARDVSGPVHLRDQSGSVSVERAAAADVRTSYAPLRASQIAGDATLADESGSVEVSDVAGAVKATTSYATMNITGGGANFICRDESGSIRLRATSAALTNVEATTSYASLDVWLAGGLAQPVVVAHTTYGRVESDFPVQNQKGGMDVPAGVPGAPRIILENQSGEIRVARE